MGIYTKGYNTEIGRGIKSSAAWVNHSNSAQGFAGFVLDKCYIRRNWNFGSVLVAQVAFKVEDIFLECFFFESFVLCFDQLIDPGAEFNSIFAHECGLPGFDQILHVLIGLHNAALVIGDKDARGDFVKQQIHKVPGRLVNGDLSAELLVLTLKFLNLLVKFSDFCLKLPYVFRIFAPQHVYSFSIIVTILTVFTFFLKRVLLGIVII